MVTVTEKCQVAMSYSTHDQGQHFHTEPKAHCRYCSLYSMATNTNQWNERTQTNTKLIWTFGVKNPLKRDPFLILTHKHLLPLLILTVEPFTSYFAHSPSATARVCTSHVLLLTFELHASDFLKWKYPEIFEKPKCLFNTYAVLFFQNPQRLLKNIQSVPQWIPYFNQFLKLQLFFLYTGIMKSHM